MAPLRILSLEDEPNDTEFIRERLESENTACKITRVDTEATFRSALEQGEVDLVLADYSLPSFDGITALKLAMKLLPDVPFIFVSGTLGEEVAIEALKIGATDYVLKTGLLRLVPSVRRALREAKERAEHKEASEELRRSQAYLAEAQKLSCTGSFGWNVGTGEIYWSDETFRIFEYEPDTAITIEKVLQRTHPEDRSGVQDFIDRISREKTEFDFEHRLLLPNGSVKYVRVIGRPSKDEAGDPEFVGAVSDVTAQKVAEQRHQGDQRQIRRIIDAMPQCIVALASDGRPLYGNQAVADYGGLLPDEIQGYDFLARTFHPEDMARIKEERGRALAKGLPFKLEMRARRKDGTYRWFEILYKPLLGENGQVLRWYASGIDIDDRKQAEERVRNENIALREDLSKQELVSLAQKSARAMVFDWYIQQEVNTWTPEQEALYGLAPGTFDGKYESWKKLIHPDDWSLIVKALKHSHETGDIFAEFRVVWPDGSIHWLASNGRMFKDDEGRPYRMVGFTGDITPRKVAEEELRHNQGYLAEAQRLTRSGSWAWNVRTRETFWSQEMFRIFGYDPEKTKPSLDLFLQRVHPDDREMFERRAQSESTQKDRVDSGVDYRIVLADGTVKHIHSLSHAVANEAGVITEIVGTTMDVTDRKRAEEELRRSEMELRQMLDFAPQNVVVFGPASERLYANRVALDYFGLSLEEWRQTPGGIFRPSWLIHPDDRERVRADSDRARFSGSAYEVELRFRKADGSYRWFLVRYNPVRDEQGQISRWYVAGTDIEERKRAEERLQYENIALREEIDQASMFEEIVGDSPSFRAVLAHLVKVAPTDSTVLITGETGTGKELIARAIHKRSKRAGRAFVSVNCAAIPSSLIASELFGHEKGAFTGALQQRVGRFESANGGTIFLDEIGELSVETQIALLRVLQEREIERVGSNSPISVDVRVLAATNRDLQAAVHAGTFRQDLFYRLNVVPIETPPLRERMDDLPLLVEYLVTRYAKKAGKKIRSISKRTLEIFEAYDWPGNVRELQNVIERAVIFCEGGTFTVDETWLTRERKSTNGAIVSFQERFAEPRNELADQERAMIEAALASCQGRVSGPSGAAVQLGIARQTLESKIKALRINKYKFKTP